MFRQSPSSTDLNLFSNISSNLGGVRNKLYTDKAAWHNLFWTHITSHIPEKKFKTLFAERMGSPNAPIRILTGMMILKEGFGWSDEQLFEQCQFNLLVMKALGLNNFDDEPPCPATYYNLKKAIYEHQIKNGEDLIGEVFRQLTKRQAEIFGVSGTFARMDSKLIGSNIAKCSRLQLILSVLQVFYKSIKDKDGLLTHLHEREIERLEALSTQKPGQIVYKLGNQSKQEMLEELGYLMLHIMERYTEADSDKYHLITRILSEQYHIEGEKIVLKETKEIEADSLQSPYDEDAAFRNKNGTKVQGYNDNLTETCNEDKLNLIADVKVEKATAADNGFVKGGIERSEEIVEHIDHLNTDGAYHSKENKTFSEENVTEHILSNMQGKAGKYEFDVQEVGNVKVINTQTGEIHQAENYKEDKYKIKENGKLRYFTKCMIMSFLQRKAIEAIPQQEKNRRNNVEASIFQLSYFTRNNKTRYRGLIKNQMWAFNRCLWINLIRIKNYMGEVCPVLPEINQIEQIINKKTSLLTENICLACFCLNKYLKKVFLGYCLSEKCYSVTIILCYSLNKKLLFRGDSKFNHL